MHVWAELDGIKTDHSRVVHKLGHVHDSCLLSRGQEVYLASPKHSRFQNKLTSLQNSPNFPLCEAITNLEELKLDKSTTDNLFGAISARIKPKNTILKLNILMESKDSNGLKSYSDPKVTMTLSLVSSLRVLSNFLTRGEVTFGSE